MAENIEPGDTVFAINACCDRLRGEVLGIPFTVERVVAPTGQRLGCPCCLKVVEPVQAVLGLKFYWLPHIWLKKFKPLEENEKEETYDVKKNTSEKEKKKPEIVYRSRPRSSKVYNCRCTVVPVKNLS